MRPLCRAAVLISLLGCALWGARPAIDWIAAPPTTDVRADYDCAWLMTGIEHTASFSETLRWWTGPWCAEGVPYYRPLTSLCFWAEYRVFGMHGLRAFTAVEVLAHLALTAALFIFLADLIGFREGALSVSLFTLDATAFFGLGTAGAVFPIWKDSCDIWCAAAYIASLWFFLRFLRKGGSGWLAGAVVSFLIALSFKEMAYTLPFMLALVAWHEGKLGFARNRDDARSTAKAIGLFFAFGGTAFLFRTWALGGFGYHNGTGGAWLSRTVVLIGGPPVRVLVFGDPFPIALLALPLALMLARRPTTRRAAAVCGLIGLAALIASSQMIGVSFADLPYRLLLVSTWTGAAWVGLFLLLVWRWWRTRRRGQTLGYLWVVIAQLPLIMVPGEEHGFYLVAVGWSIWLAYSLLDLATIGYEVLRYATTDFDARLPSAAQHDAQPLVP